jgi:hypothetical protein
MNNQRSMIRSNAYIQTQTQMPQYNTHPTDGKKKPKKTGVAFLLSYYILYTMYHLIRSSELHTPQVLSNQTKNKSHDRAIARLTPLEKYY